MSIHKPILTNRFELRLFGTLGIILIVLIAFSFIAGNMVKREDESVPSMVVTNYFENLDLKARAIYVYDVRTNKVLFSRNADTRMALASLTKVMTAVVAMDIAPEYSTVTVTQNALNLGGNSGLRVNEKWTLKNLLDFSLTSSSNDGAKAVALALGALNQTNATDTQAENDFINMMNVKADELNMKNTYYVNETGLDESTTKNGAYGTAKDMTTLFKYIIENKPQLLEATQQSTLTISSLDNIVHKVKNTDAIVADIPGIKASKTGFTDIAGGNLVVAFDPELGRPIIITVLGSTQTDRFTDVQKLVNATLQTIDSAIITK
jgi:D-alanyl-D-alanine carboxypeptidase (penicillin-binding protein 5/6)